jgi:hypothetical protein
MNTLHRRADAAISSSTVPWPATADHGRAASSRNNRFSASTAAPPQGLS